jgi:hypothetical protein
MGKKNRRTKESERKEEMERKTSKMCGGREKILKEFFIGT